MKFLLLISLVIMFAVGHECAVLELDNDPEYREARAALFNDGSTSGWILFNYVGPSTIHFETGGEGGIDELKPLLGDAEIQYGIIRVMVQEQSRDVFFCWIGPGVGNEKRQDKLGFLGDAQVYLQPFHADITVLKRDNFNNEYVIDRSGPLSGSHIID